jgi:hypothetical protein
MGFLMTLLLPLYLNKYSLNIYPFGGHTYKRWRYPARYNPESQNIISSENKIKNSLIIDYHIYNFDNPL